mmetsp:Transcript_2924/g.6988  ORF Transcript_2924/g.6988 Transcript_2924/m.6988 type:complete len:216 (-) Transcript_2924:169-816(-)
MVAPVTHMRASMSLFALGTMISQSPCPPQRTARSFRLQSAATPMFFVAFFSNAWQASSIAWIFAATLLAASAFFVCMSQVDLAASSTSSLSWLALKRAPMLALAPCRFTKSFFHINSISSVSAAGSMASSRLDLEVAWLTLGASPRAGVYSAALDKPPAKASEETEAPSRTSLVREAENIPEPDKSAVGLPRGLAFDALGASAPFSGVSVLGLPP